jgi:UDP-glucose 4-epimerase
MKIIIIGSKGFIGSHAQQFFSTDNEVWGADIFDDDSANYFKLDKQLTNYEPLFLSNVFDVCINASGNGSVPISLNQPVFDFELNVLNTIKLLDALRLHNPLCKYINMSSAAVYGNPPQIPVKEDMALKPLSPYGWHKLYAEQICKEYYYLYNLRTVNLRLFSVYGERLKKQLFWDIYQKCIRSKNVELFGIGIESRDFIYINDLMHAIKCIIEQGLFNGEAINVGSGTETTIKDAAETFCHSVDPEIKVYFNMITKPGDPLNWCADNTFLRQLGFECKTSLKDGLENTVKWIKQNN